MTDNFCVRSLENHGWAQFIVPDDLLNSLNNSVDLLKATSSEIINPHSENSTIVHELDIANLLEQTEFKEIYQKYILTDFFRDFTLSKVFYVIDTPSSINRNQIWHFDSVPKIKIILGLSGIDSSSSTKFLNNSHKSLYSIVNFYLYKFSKGKIQLAKNGCEKLPFFNKLCKKFQIGNNISPSRSVIFNTNCIHSAGFPLNGTRRIMILHFESM